MPRFRYTAFDAQGNERSGQIEALAAEGVASELKARGLFPTEVAIASAAEEARAPAPDDVREAGRRALLQRELRLPWTTSIPAREIAAFTRQLGTLLGAGMPLVRSLEVLGRQEKNRALARIIALLAEDIRSGGVCSTSLARHSRVFDRLYVNMVRAGEAGGVLDVALERLAQFQEKSLRLRGKVKAALVYPAIVLSVAVLILAGLLVFVVPKFQQIFADLLKGAPLPALTQAVLVASALVRQHFVVVAVVVVALGSGLRAFRRTRRGARLVDGWLLRLPGFGELIRKSLVARFARTFGTLLASGVPMLQAITIARDTSGNARVVEALDLVHDRVKEGAPVARPLAASAVFPPLVTSMIEVGEQTGQLPEMLHQVADIYDEEVDTAVAGLSSLIEPVLIVLLAVVVGTIVVALFLPIVRIVQLLT
jgi:type IV pilus assembly protein PilC